MRLVNDDLIGAHVEERIEESVKGRLATTRCPFSKKKSSYQLTNRPEREKADDHTDNTRRWMIQGLQG